MSLFSFFFYFAIEDTGIAKILLLSGIGSFTKQIKNSIPAIMQCNVIIAGLLFNVNYFLSGRAVSFTANSSRLRVLSNLFLYRFM